MNARPSISVVIPAIRGGDYLRDALASVRRQDYSPFDIWVVDNGRSGKVREEVSPHGDSVHVLTEQNPGAAHARNLGVRQSPGDLVAFLDEDDLWTPGHLRRMAETLTADPQLGIAQGRIRNFKTLMDGRCVYCSPDYQFTSLASAVYRRWVFDRVGLFDGTLTFGEDTDYWIRCWEQGIRKTAVEAVSLLYRRHDGNMTANKNLKELGVVQVFQRRLTRKRMGADRLPETRGLKEYLGEPLAAYDSGSFEELPQGS